MTTADDDDLIGETPLERATRMAEAYLAPRQPTPQELAQLVATKFADKMWRMNNLYVILNEDGLVEQFRLRHEQIDFLQNRHHRNFVPKARKLGMSTLIVLDYLDSCLFTKDFRCGVIDIKEADAQDKLSIARFAWDKGPTEHPDLALRMIWATIITKSNKLMSSSNGHLAWRNGSEYTAGVRYTGKTPLKLHISEFGPIAAQAPKVAEDIVRGSMNAVPMNGTIDVETTMEGGRIGHCYHIFKQALHATKENQLTPLDWRMHFFSWLGHPSYRIRGARPKLQSTADYFDKLTETHRFWIMDKFGWADGIIPSDRQAWWEKKRESLKDLMWQQFPSTVDECDMANVTGQIYPEMTTVRNQGRVTTFNPEPHLPFFMSADLGSSVNTALWLHQPAGKQHNVIDCAFGEGKGAAWVAETFRKWETQHGQIVQLIIPHDANTTDKGSGLTYVENLVKCGIPRNKITVVPRTPDVWAGVDAVRKMLPRCWFHVRTDTPTTDTDGNEHPGGVVRLEGYRVRPSTSGAASTNPFKDGICDHAADGFRTYAEADEQSLVRTHLRVEERENGTTSITGQRTVKVIMQQP